MRQPWSLLSLKNMVAPWMHPMEKAMNIKSPGSQVQVMMWCFCCDFLLIWSSLEIVILYTGILRGFEQPSFIGLSPMMRVPFPNPKTRIWRGFSKEVVAFPHQSWMPLLSVAFQPGYLDLGTAVAVVTMLSSDYVSWWNGGGAITQHRCRGLLGIHHLATARMSIIKNWIAFIGFISVWMVCLTEFSASKKKFLLVFDHVCELLTLRAYHSYMTSVGIRLSAKTLRSRCLWSAMLSDGSHLLEIWWRSLAAQAQKLINYDKYGQIWKHDEKWWKMIVSEAEGFCTIISG